MSSSRLLIASVAFNLVAIAALGYFVTRPAATPVPESNAPAPNGTKSAPARPGASRGGSTTVITETEAFHWRQIEAEDFKKYIANLRGVACPEETVKDIIIADVNKLYAPRLAALNAPVKPYRYWEARSVYSEPPDRERDKQRRDLLKEKKDLLMELLGIDIDEENRKLSGYPDYEERTMGFLSKEKRELVREIQRKFSEMEQDIYRKTDGRIYEEDQAELKKIRDARRAELAKVLSPQELLEWELRNSNTASQMRYDMASFEPSETEFRSIFEARNEFDNQYGRNYNPEETPEERKARAEAQKKSDDAVKAALGDERYAEYQRSRDYSYQELARIGKRYDLPKESATQVWDLKKTAEDQARKVRMDANLTSEQRNAALKAIRDETQKAVTGVLGDKAYKSYQRSGGYWLNNISPTPTSGMIIGP